MNPENLTMRWMRRDLHFRKPARTSRNVLTERPVWYLVLREKGEETAGIGECAPIEGLSRDPIARVASMLAEVARDLRRFVPLDDTTLAEFPAIRFALETAILDLKHGGTRILAPSAFTRGDATIPINGLIWMGDFDAMAHQVAQKIEEGWRCIKIKIGALALEKELDLLRGIRDRFPRQELELRVDANGAFAPEQVMRVLDRLAEFDLHSIEQPIPTGRWDELGHICRRSPVPIALDEELIPMTGLDHFRRVLDAASPQFLVLKPSFLGGVDVCAQMVSEASSLGIACWVTSALESNIGLNAIAQWTFGQHLPGYQGLGTGQLFTNNIPSPLQTGAGELTCRSEGLWNVSEILP
ncbi:MAG: o-succinylbenzoate synthase [Candidatus Latescibacterota bacterium]